MVTKMRIIMSTILITLGLVVGANFASAATGADLTVQNISLSSSNILTVQVGNTGDTDVSSSTKGYTYIYLDGTLKWTYSWSTLSDKSFLTAGGSSTIQPKTLSGTYTVKACVDPSGVVTESDETNNCMETSLSTEPATQADLTVSSVSVDSTSGVLSVTVANTGNADVSSSTKGHTYIYIDDVLEWTYSWSTLADKSFLTAGDSATIQPQTLSDTHVVKACVDPNSVVTESNEDNNCTESTVTGPTSALPDLTVSYIGFDDGEYSDPKDELGSWGTVYVKTSNIGDANVDTTAGTTTVYMDGALIYDETWDRMSDQDFLTAGESSVFAVTMLTSGTHTFEACVDTMNIVTESDETNNCLETSLSLGTTTTTTDTTTTTTDTTVPNLTVSAVLVDSTSGVLSVTVANNGNEDITTTSGYTYIYIDSTLKWTYKWSTLADQSFLEAGEYSVLQPQTLNDTHTVKTCVDPTNVVSESDEDDNCMETSVTGPASTTTTTTDTTTTTTTTDTTYDTLPDLYIQNIFVNPKGTLSVRVRNRGYTDVTTESGYTYIYIDGVLEWTYSWSTLANTAFLKAHSASTIQPQTLTGEHTVKACVDPTNVVSESSDDNNCLEVTVGNMELPDLYVNSLWVGRDGTLNVMIKNRSATDITATDGIIQIYVDGELEYSYNWSTLSNQRFLKAHKMSIIKPLVLSSGSHTVKVVVDSSNVVAESSEDNNSFEAVVTVKAQQ